MVYITEVLVFLAVLISVTVSRATYGPRRPAKYLPPKRTYNPVKEVVKKTVLPKKGSTLPIRDRIDAFFPEGRQDGGFITRGIRDSVLGRADRLNGRSGFPTDHARSRIPIRNLDSLTNRMRRIPNDPIGLRSDLRTSRRGLSSASDLINRRNGDPWVDRELPIDPLVDSLRSRRLSNSRSLQRDIGRGPMSQLGDGFLEQGILRNRGLGSLSQENRVRDVISRLSQTASRLRNPLARQTFRESQSW